MRTRKHLTFAVAAAFVCASATACKDDYSIADPPGEPTLDVQLRQTIGGWGAVPILAPQQQNPALVDLGRSLFFDKILSGNKDVSCATCHTAQDHLTDALSLAVGTGGIGVGASRTLGTNRQFVPRNAPSLLNGGIGLFYMFWDGRVNEEGGLGRFRTPTGVVFANPNQLSGLLAAQAMLPVLNRVEMRGNAGDVDQSGNPNELAAIPDANASQIWAAAMKRLLAIQEYQAKFNAAYPGFPTSSLSFEHAANALAAYQIQTFTRTNSPFDQFLAGNNRAMSADEKHGALLFFGKARCSTCHSGPLLGGQQFANVGAPQIGPGVGSAAPLDIGRGEDLQFKEYKFAFRVQPLRNVELTAPYFHSGAYSTLEQVVRHYNNADSAQRNFDSSKLAPAVRAMYHGEPTTKQAVLETLDFRLREPLRLTQTEQSQLVAFLKSLTDPAARDLSSVVPASVPSGLSVR